MHITTCAHCAQDLRQNSAMMHNPTMLDASLHNPSPDYAAELIHSIGKSQSWIARKTGISRRRIVYLLQGERTDNGITRPVCMTYPEQYILESLAAAMRSAS